MQKNTFLFVIEKLNGGGAERALSVLASGIADLGYDVHVLVHTQVKDEYELSSSVNVHYDRPFGYKKEKLFPKLKKLYRIRKTIRKINPTYVIPFLNVAILHTFIVTRFMKVKFISTIRVNPVYEVGVKANICKWIARKADALFAQNEIEKKYYPYRVQRKTFIVANPVNKDIINSKKEYRNDISKIVLLGRLSEQKNYKMAIRAAKTVFEQKKEITFTIYGEGELESELRQFILSENLENKVLLAGRTSDVISVLLDADMYIMTSNFEGMPNSLMEAMAVGLPCISTDCQCGPSDLINNGKNGILVSVNDSEELAKKILYLINNVDLSKKLGENARKTICEKYTTEKIAAQFVYECQKY